MASRNANSFFSEFPALLDIGRSRFERPSTHKTSFDCGSLIPFFYDEVMPGDSFSIKTHKLIRMSTLVAPIFGDIYLDVYYFYIPYRILWQHFVNLMGESDRAWLPSVTYSAPQMTSPSGGFATGTVADYLGLPPGVDDLSVSALPFRAYVAVYNAWFRDENLIDPALELIDDNDEQGDNTDPVYGGVPFKVAKLHDEFTSALPAPQRGPDVMLPLGQTAPILGGVFDFEGLTSGAKPLEVQITSSVGPGANAQLRIKNDDPNITTVANERLGIPANTLYADLSAATGSSINALRMAFQIQKFYEEQARSGSRYREIIKGLFNVVVADSRMMIPEYLGGNRTKININQVVQNSATDAVSPQGHTTAYSLTANSNADFTKSFQEHGAVLGVMCARYKHSYQNGIERFWSRKDREDWYFPVFANIGEVSLKNKEIYAQGTSVVDADGNVIDEQTFGYQEAWFDYRYKPDRISGELRSTYATSLDMWHLGDDYNSLPYLSQSWIEEDKANLDRCLAVTSANANQFIADILVENTCVRPMPLYSIPGLIDHH